MFIWSLTHLIDSLLLIRVSYVKHCVVLTLVRRIEMSLIIEPVTGPHVRLTESAFPVQRMTNVAVIPDAIRNNYPYAGYPGRGFTTGYSTYSNVNQSGTHFLAFGTQGWICALFTAEGEFVRFLYHYWESGKKPIGEHNDIRWSKLPGEEMRIYYTDGTSVFSTHVLSEGGQEKVATFPTAIKPENHSDQGINLRFARVNGVLQQINLRDNSVVSGDPSLGIYDVGDDGLLVNGKIVTYVGTSDTIPFAKQAHAAWCHLADSTVYVYQDTVDYISSYDPIQKKYSALLHIQQDGEWLNLHVGRGSVASAGWALISTYQKPDAVGWASNQLFLLELNAENPRVIRLGSHQNTWGVIESGGKAENYFAEAFACLSPAGRFVYYTTNVSGNLEVWRMTLPEGWQNSAKRVGEEVEEPPVVVPEPEPSELALARAEIQRLKDDLIQTSLKLSESHGRIAELETERASLNDTNNILNEAHAGIEKQLITEHNNYAEASRNLNLANTRIAQLEATALESPAVRTVRVSVPALSFEIQVEG
jgi:hypothetical protein